MCARLATTFPRNSDKKRTLSTLAVFVMVVESCSSAQLAIVLRVSFVFRKASTRILLRCRIQETKHMTMQVNLWRLVLKDKMSASIVQEVDSFNEFKNECCTNKAKPFAQKGAISYHFVHSQDLSPISRRQQERQSRSLREHENLRRQVRKVLEKFIGNEEATEASSRDFRISARHKRISDSNVSESNRG